MNKPGMRKHAQRRWVLFSAGMVPLFILCACIIRPNLKHDPFYDSFLEKTSLIMTDEELDIYLSLPDRPSKLEFIEEFWKMRDPDPSTEENENRLEFERRVAFANRWFNRFGNCRGWSSTKDASNDWGWNTDRGRVYIVMGHPDMITLPDFPNSWEPADVERGDLICRASAWYYERFQIYYPFYSDKNISSVSTNTDSMIRAKLDMVSWEYRGLTEKPFRFEADFKDGAIKVRIPVKRISFEAADEKLTASFDVEVRVYRNNKRVDVLNSNKVFEFVEEEFPDIKNLEMLIPYEPEKRGKYLFDIILTFRTSQTTSRYRNYVKKKF